MIEQEFERPSDKSMPLAFVLALLFGIFGAHRFYVGKVGTGLLQLVTLGGLGIWVIIDLVIILFGEFQDSEGSKLE